MMRPQTIGVASMLHSSLARTAKENPISSRRGRRPLLSLDHHGQWDGSHFIRCCAWRTDTIS